MSGDPLKSSQARPFGTASDYNPDTKQLAEQVAILAGNVSGLEGHLNRLGKQMSELATHVDARVDALGKVTQAHVGAVQRDVAMLRADLTGSDHDIDMLQHQVVKDHAPRITAVEKVTAKQHLQRAGIYGVPLATVLGIVQFAWNRWPEIARFIRALFEAAQ